MSLVAILWLILGAGAALFVFALRRLNKTRPKLLGLSHFDEIHHGYVGGFTALGILIALTLPRAFAIGFAITGIFLLVEDAISHLIQSFMRVGWRGLVWHIYAAIVRRIHKRRSPT